MFKKQPILYYLLLLILCFVFYLYFLLLLPTWRIKLMINDYLLTHVIPLI